MTSYRSTRSPLSADQLKERDMNSQRARIFLEDLRAGYKFIQIKIETDDAISEIRRQLKGECYTYNDTIMMLVQVYKNAHGLDGTLSDIVVDEE